MAALHIAVDKIRNIGVLSQLLIAALTAQAADWNGSGDGASWSDFGNWSGGTVPNGENATLGDVTSGTRTISITSAVPAITALAMSQTTAGATNVLSLGADLTINGTSPFAINPAAGTESVILNLVGGDFIVNPASGDAATTLDGLVLLSNNSRIRTTELSSMAQTFTFRGQVHSEHDSGDPPGVFVRINRGTFSIGGEDDADASLTVASGDFRFGKLETSAVAWDKHQTVNNWGAITVKPDASMTLQTHQNWENATYNNMPGAVLVLGASNSLGGATLGKHPVQDTGGTQPGTFPINNGGLIRLYGSSRIRPLISSEAASTFSNSGILEIHAAQSPAGYWDSQYVSIYNIQQHVFENSGVVSLARHSDLPEEQLAMVRFGSQHDSSTFNFKFDNLGGGSLVADGDLVFDLVANSLRSTGYKMGIILENSQNATITFGHGCADDSKGTTVLMRFISNVGTPFISVVNEGLFNLLGGSALEVPSNGVMIAGQTLKSTLSEWAVTNKATGVFHLNHTARVGNADRPVAFFNAGTLRKSGDATSTIHGSVVFDAGSTFAIDSGAEPGAFPPLHVNGDLALGNATLELLHPPSGPMTVLSCSGTLSGTFGTIVNAPGFTAIYTADKIKLVNLSTVICIR